MQFTLSIISPPNCKLIKAIDKGKSVQLAEPTNPLNWDLVGNLKP